MAPLTASSNCRNGRQTDAVHLEPHGVTRSIAASRYDRCCGPESPPKAAAAPSKSLDREALLKEVFAAMDDDAVGVVDINEFKATAKSGDAR